MSEIDTRVRQEEVQDVEAGEIQEVRLQMEVTTESDSYGTSRTTFSVLFARSDDSDGFLWSRALLPPNPSKDDTKRQFNLFHIIGIEAAVEYMEEHYGEVTNSYPAMTDP